MDLLKETAMPVDLAYGESMFPLRQQRRTAARREQLRLRVEYALRLQPNYSKDEEAAFLEKNGYPMWDNAQWIEERIAELQRVIDEPILK